MKKVTLYYKKRTLTLEIPESDYTLLMKNWKDRGNRGYITTVTTKRGTQYDIDLTKVELIETENTMTTNV